MKTAGLIVLLTLLTPSAFAAGGYVEVWNPPESRMAAPHRTKNASHRSKHRHGPMHTVKLRSRPSSAPAARLASRPGNSTNAHDALPARTPNMSDIPRQITPEGNVLRVGAQGLSAGVTR